MAHIPPYQVFQYHQESLFEIVYTRGTFTYTVYIPGCLVTQHGSRASFQSLNSRLQLPGRSPDHISSTISDLSLSRLPPRSLKFSLISSQHKLHNGPARRSPRRGAVRPAARRERERGRLGHRQRYILLTTTAPCHHSNNPHVPDSEVSDVDDDDAFDETLLDRVYALKDIVPPTYRKRLASAADTGYSWVSSGLSFSGKTLWVVSTSALLLGVPWALAFSEEQQVQEMEREMRMQQSANEV